LSICQLHILLSRTVQISLELHFCVELDTKKALFEWFSIGGLLTTRAPSHNSYRKFTLENKRIKRKLYGFLLCYLSSVSVSVSLLDCLMLN